MKILPTILAELTGVSRYKPEIAWSDIWVSNLFRVFELIFWRRAEIRLESTAKACNLNGKTVVVYKCYSLEAKLAYKEVWLRNLLSWRPAFRFVPVPQFALSGGALMRSPFMFAIALDNNANSNYTGASALSFAYTTTGSNMVMAAATWKILSTSTPTYNSVSLVASVTANAGGAGDYIIDTWYLVAPTTGSNTFADTSTLMEAEVVTFSGAKQSGQPDSTKTFTNAASLSTITVTVTTVVDNCMAAFFEWDANGANPAASTGLTLLNREVVNVGTFSAYSTSTPITPAGNYAMTMTHNAGIDNEVTVIAFAPVAVSPSDITPRIFRSLLGVGM